MKANKNYTSRIALWVMLICFTATISGCSIYRINIQQGNYIDQEKIDQIEAGMTRNQVKYLLGTPLIADAFHNNRWDYVYQAKFGRTGRVFNRKVTVFFDGDNVTQVEQYGQETQTDKATETEAAKDDETEQETQTDKDAETDSSTNSAK